ncbi:hypothetical protein ACFKHW_17320 [Bradyrhizobium lupini]|uniref:hypothetical protein n=1 Tax=Rhizobium lupini TaxID=136996 RepID=UPI00366E8018
MPETNWKRIDQAQRGIGPLLLRIGQDATDPAFVGHQDPDSGRWFDQENREVTPRWFCLVPEFDGAVA